MFERIGSTAADVTILVDGKPVPARAGDTVAAALLAFGIVGFRANPVNGDIRGPYCMMGVCQDCRVTMDGQPDVQACATPVADGMRVGLTGGRGDG